MRIKNGPIYESIAVVADFFFNPTQAWNSVHFLRFHRRQPTNKSMIAKISIILFLSAISKKKDC